jgi:hypothetical protein
MRKAIALAAVLSLCIAPVGFAGEVAGVTLPDTTIVEGKTLKLNGIGLRKKVVFKVYVAGLYLETPAHDAETIVSSDQVKRMQLSLLRSLSTAQITEAIGEGFEKNSKAQMGALKARLDRFNAMIPNLEKGDQILLTYFPGKGTAVSAKGVDKGVIEGKDFADALFAVWLGPTPVQANLKASLLGG